MRLDALETYLKSETFLPHFILVSDETYTESKNALIEQQFHVIHLNDFCIEDDKLPNTDTLFDRLCRSSYSKIVVFGLGEYLALMGEKEGYRVLSKLKDLSLAKPNKVVILLRGVFSIMKKIQSLDKIRFDERRLTCIGDNLTSSLSIVLTSLPLGDSLSNGCKALLSCMENEDRLMFMANTKINFPNASIPVRGIKQAYDGIQFLIPEFKLPEMLGTEKQWLFLLTELTQHNRSLEEVFKHYNLINDLEKNWQHRINSSNDHAWLYFIALQFNIKQLSNKYLAWVLEKTNRIEDLENNILESIINISYTDKQFLHFYQDRKILIEKISETKMRDFIVSNRKLPNDSIYRLTDTTLAERKEIICLIVKNEVVPSLDSIYPSLAHYMKLYTFTNCNDTLSQLLTSYFHRYKYQKLLNKLDEMFLNDISEMAITANRCYNQLSTRNQIIDALNKNNSYLYWLDALGVEYIAYIQEGCKVRDLTLKVNIGRANLPTITSLNRDFFSDWSGDKNLPHGDKRLDEIKHKESEYNFNKEQLPIHLAEELRIIDTVLDRVDTDLKSRKYHCFILTSDHGASRLAVLKRQEEKYESDTKGEHSGRCCKFFEGCDLPAATHENDYLVLADYGRFKGSRSANVEVHGGATLEEVLVPIFEIILKDPTVSVELMTPTVKISHRKIAEITLFSKSLDLDLSVRIDGKSYTPIKTDEHHYTISLPDIKRQGIYLIEVYNRGAFIEELSLTVQNESAIKNDRFENLF